MKVVFPYPGGKANIVQQLLAEFPMEGRYYVEPFAGRGNVFFEVTRNCFFKEYWINDIQTGSFFEALRDVDLTQLPARVTVDDFYYWENQWLQDNPIAYVLEPKITFRGKGYGSGYQEGRYKRARYLELCQAAQNILRNRNIKIFKQDYVWMKWDQLTEDDLVYLDPPYENTGGVGLRQIDHIELLELLRDAKFKWALSGYASDLYLAELGDPILEFERRLEMTDSRGSTAVECLWVNY